MLAKEEVSPKVAGMFYQGIVVSVLLYRNNTLVLPPLGLKVLEGFHAEAACHFTGMSPKNKEG